MVQMVIGIAVAKSFSVKRVSLILWITLFPMFLLLWYFPYIDLRIRIASLAVGILLVTGTIVVVWRFKLIRWISIAICIAIALFLLLPTTIQKNRADLRTAYCKALKSYTGCRYVWGGEGYFGIDCSGFVRKGLEDALATKGCSTFDPSLVRESISLYWHDTTAKVIGEGYSGRTIAVTTCPTLNSLDHSLLLPGDMAVTSSGDHIMAYLGDKVWIAADPGEAKVTQFTIPEEKNAYFSTPMRIVRWKILSD